MLDIDTFPEDLIPTAWTLNSCSSLSLEASSLNELEHTTASNDGNLSVVSDEINGRGFHLCGQANHDVKIGCGSPYRVRRTAKHCGVSDSVSHIHTSFNASILAEDKNASTMNVTMTNCENKARVIMAVSHRKRPHYGVQVLWLCLN